MAKWNEAPEKTAIATVRIARGFPWSRKTSSKLVNRQDGMQRPCRYSVCESELEDVSQSAWAIE